MKFFRGFSVYDDKEFGNIYGATKNFWDIWKKNSCKRRKATNISDFIQASSWISGDIKFEDEEQKWNFRSNFFFDKKIKSFAFDALAFI